MKYKIWDVSSCRGIPDILQLSNMIGDFPPEKNKIKIKKGVHAFSIPYFQSDFVLLLLKINLKFKH